MRLHRVARAVVVGPHRVGIVEIGHLSLGGGRHRASGKGNNKKLGWILFSRDLCVILPGVFSKLRPMRMDLSCGDVRTG